MEILSAEQMQRVDRRAETDHGIPSETLMDNAGREVAEAILEMAEGDASRRILILCGKGNNGGDGITAARHLAASGLRARVALLGQASDLKGAAAWALSTARSAGIEVEEISGDEEWTALRWALPENDIVVDALLGTGTRGAARGRILDAIRAVNASGCDVVSVDIPSGLSGSSAALPGPCIEARVTLALAALKIPLAFPPACRYAGHVRVLDIGIPSAAMEAEGAELHWADAGLVAALIPPRAADAHKGRFGHVLVVAGSRGKSGAAALMARACLRSGAGLVTVAAPASAQPAIAAQVAEAMCEPLPETGDGSLATAALPLLQDLLEGKDVLAAGPGLGTGKETTKVVSSLVAGCRKPMILDADALNILAASSIRPGWDPERTVLTPHPGEAARLTGGSAAQIQEDRLGAARSLAAERKATVVLKGYRTLTAEPSGLVVVNPTGNPGMASGGAGDVLAGMVAAWLAQGLNGPDAAILSAHVHGLAGDLAAEELGEISLVAGDLVEALPYAYRRLAAS